MDLRVLLDDNPLAPSNAAFPDFEKAQRSRPAWIAPRHQTFSPEVTAYRVHFILPQSALIQTHVSADERYKFFVDGNLMGRGPERGSDRAWFYETYDLDLSAGQHTLVAIVWRLGEIGPQAQISLAPGFLLEAEGPFGTMISTRSAAWETKPVRGITFSMPTFSTINTAWFVQPLQTTNAEVYPWGIEKGDGEDWEAPTVRHEDFLAPYGLQALHILYPASLPAQLAAPRNGGKIRHVAEGAWSDVEVVEIVPGTSLQNEEIAWQDMLDKATPLVVPPHTHRQVIIDLDDYVCAYPQI